MDFFGNTIRSDDSFTTFLTSAVRWTVNYSKAADIVERRATLKLNGIAELQALQLRWGSSSPTPAKRKSGSRPALNNCALAPRRRIELLFQP